MIPEVARKGFAILSAAHSTELQPASYSGARVWKIVSAHQAYALKQWPIGHPVHMSLPEIHRHMMQAREAGLVWVPAPISCTQGTTVLQIDRQNWDLCSWQKGESTLIPDAMQLENIARALAQLHAVWRMRNDRVKAPCRAVLLQHEKLATWRSVPMQMKHAAIGSAVYQEALHTVDQHRQAALKLLEAWLSRKVPQQHCVADLRIEHILFTDRNITGMVDYGGMRMDHPAQDFARLFTSMAEVPLDVRRQALAAYHPVTQEFEALLGVLEKCGLLIGIINWLTWLWQPPGQAISFKQGEERLQFLLKRFYDIHKSFFC